MPPTLASYSTHSTVYQSLALQIFTYTLTVSHVPLRLGLCRVFWSEYDAERALGALEQSFTFPDQQQEGYIMASDSQSFQQFILMHNNHLDSCCIRVGDIL